MQPFWFVYKFARICFLYFVLHYEKCKVIKVIGAFCSQINTRKKWGQRENPKNAVTNNDVMNAAGSQKPKADYFLVCFCFADSCFISIPFLFFYMMFVFIQFARWYFGVSRAIRTVKISISIYERAKKAIIQY